MSYALIKQAPRFAGDLDVWTIASLTDEGVWECVAPGMDEAAARLAFSVLHHGPLGVSLTTPVSQEPVSEILGAERCPGCGERRAAGDSYILASDPEVFVCSQCYDKSAGTA